MDTLLVSVGICGSDFVSYLAKLLEYVRVIIETQTHSTALYRWYKQSKMTKTIYFECKIDYEHIHFYIRYDIQL